MNHLDLFSGIGGFSLGLERAGMNTVGFCEQDPYCLSKLDKHWPDVPKHSDIKTLTGEIIEREMGQIDVISGGFPCQPFSHAGQQKGQQDDRHLWPEMLRIIAQTRPTWIIGENVTGIIALALDDVLYDLESQNYTAQPFIIPAASVGAIHRRNRVWIVAHTHTIDSRQRSSQQPEGADVDRLCQGITTHTSSVGFHAGVEYAQQQTRHDTNRPIRQQPSKVGQGDHATQQPGAFEQKESAPRSTQQSRYYRDTCEPIGMPTQPAICPRNDGLPDRVARLKALGNAVVPQIPEIIGRAIMGVGV